jgi:hypothetical protein
MNKEKQTSGKQQNGNLIYNLLGTVPIQDLFMCSNFDLTPYGMDAYCSTVKPYRIAIFWNTKPNEERKAVQVEIPTYEKKHPEKLEATSFGLFTVHEYTKREAYSTTEIDWECFKSKFVDACLELHRHCA